MNFLLPVLITAFLLCVTNVRAEDPTFPLQTMTKEELETIYDCIVKSPEALCGGFEKCNSMKPKNVLDAFTQCGDRLGNNSDRKCDGPGHLYSPEINRAIFDCTAQNCGDLSQGDKDKLREFETCIKGLNACGTAN